MEGDEITTVEGLGTEGGQLDPLQQAFTDHGAVQCGFCTPGMLMTAHALLNKHAAPTEKDVRLAISGNICRCTGYTKIVEAIIASVKTGKIGDGKIFVLPVDSVCRIRTGERDKEAI